LAKKIQKNSFFQPFFLPLWVLRHVDNIKKPVWRLMVLKKNITFAHQKNNTLTNLINL